MKQTIRFTDCIDVAGEPQGPAVIDAATITGLGAKIERSPQVPSKYRKVYVLALRCRGLYLLGEFQMACEPALFVAAIRELVRLRRELRDLRDEVRRVGK